MVGSSTRPESEVEPAHRRERTFTFPTDIDRRVPLPGNQIAVLDLPAIILPVSRVIGPAKIASILALIEQPSIKEPT